MLLIIRDILPMDKGTQAFTEYEFDNRFVDYMMKDEERMNWKIGHIHSHNTMNVFFSGTDMSELNDNSDSHNFYLSLIVNNYMDFEAKVAFRGAIQKDITKTPYISLDENGKKYTISKEDLKFKKEKLFIYNCDIISEQEEIIVNQEFKEGVEAIIKKAEKPIYVQTFPPQNRNPIKGFANIIPNNPIIPNSPLTKVVTTNKKQIDLFQEFVDDIDFEEIDNDTFLEEDELDLIQDFIYALLNYTNTKEDDTKTIDDVLEDLELNVTIGAVKIEEICRQILENFVPLYKNMFTEEEDDENFIYITNRIVEELEELEIEYKVVSKIKLAIKFFLQKFEEYGSAV